MTHPLASPVLAPDMPEPGEEADRHWSTAVALLTDLYGNTPALRDWHRTLRDKVDAVAAARRPKRAPGWQKHPSVVGYSAYIDRFASTLQGTIARIPYLRALGIRYFHPLPLARPRTGENDGGFAVADYLDTDPRLGTMDDLRALIAALDAADIALVLDVVCNHTADDHGWAMAAKAGDERYRAFYHALDSADEVAAWERSLADVFPQAAPGNFTAVEAMGGWVWTSFYPYQWDLNYANPAVFAAMLDVLLDYAAMGVAGFRLDSVPFLWKEKGTACRNLPQAHAIVQAWRALLSIAAPDVIFKAEAIEQLGDVLPFFGPEAERPECQLAYNNVVMTALWASLATGDARIAGQAIEDSARRPDRGGWLNYVRCHDDIIWSALKDRLPADRLKALSAFYAGVAGDSFARGEAFQAWAGSAPSTNGMAAALTGVDPHGAFDDAGVSRLLLLYGVNFFLDGLPLIYMGDEIALDSDPGWRGDPARSGDGRWQQRPGMDWSAAVRRGDPTSIAGHVFTTLRRYVAIRGTTPAFADPNPARAIETGILGVLGVERGNRAALCLANFTPDTAIVRDLARPFAGAWRDLLTGERGTSDVPIARWGIRWLESSP